MKTLVINSETQTKVPFLRGILIRNLLDAGLSFSEAYALADQTRKELEDVRTISSEELREKIAQKLLEVHGEAASEAFVNPSSIPAKIQVSNLSGATSAFSRGRHIRYLQSSAVSAEKAEGITAMLFNELVAADVSNISTCQLGYLTYECVRQELGRKAGNRYLVWSEFQRSGRPLLLLICGAVGTGKSSITTELGHLLEIVRTQSTDMLREVMRSMVSENLVPVLHKSSFEAWEALPTGANDDRSHEQLVCDGYHAQVGLLSVACEAVLDRASKESTPLILEGIHAHPSLVSAIPRGQ